MLENKNIGQTSIEPLEDDDNASAALLNPLLKSLGVTQEEIDQMITEERNKLLGSTTSPTSNSSPMSTNNNSLFFKRHSFQFRGLKALNPLLQDWATAITEPNLKLQVLCLFSKIDILLSKQDSQYYSYAYSSLLFTLRTIVDNEKVGISINPKTKAHVYFTIARALEENHIVDEKPLCLYLEALPTFTLHTEQHNNPPIKVIKDYFLKEARELHPHIENIEEGFLALYLSKSIQKLLANRYVENKTSRSPSQKKLRPSLCSFNDIFQPRDTEKGSNVQSIIKNSVDEMFEHILHILNTENSVAEAITCVDIIRMIGSLSRLAKISFEYDYDLALNGLDHQISDNIPSFSNNLQP